MFERTCSIHGEFDDTAAGVIDMWLNTPGNILSVALEYLDGSVDHVWSRGALHNQCNNILVVIGLGLRRAVVAEADKLAKLTLVL
jgi:hypothetical protein